MGEEYCIGFDIGGTKCAVSLGEIENRLVNFKTRGIVRKLTYQQEKVKKMKIYLIADIEGTCGFTHIEEGEQGGSLYPYFCRQMTNEVASACESAFLSGTKEVLVHDAHGCSRNLLLDLLPKKARIMRKNCCLCATKRYCNAK